MKYFLNIFCVFIITCSFSQKDEDEVYSGILYIGDTIINYRLPDLEVLTGNNEYLKKYRITKYYVKKVYDYAQIASAMLEDFQDTLETIDSRRKRNSYLKQANKILKMEFGDEIRNMSVTRGEYLMKLIYRETKMTTYEIIGLYRSKRNALWFQALCKLNGQDLKRVYDPYGEDIIIEKVVREIEEGNIKYDKRNPKTEAAKKSTKNRIKKRKKDK